jgi:hypothetical protein
LDEDHVVTENSAVAPIQMQFSRPRPRSPLKIKTAQSKPHHVSWLKCSVCIYNGCWYQLSGWLRFSSKHGNQLSWLRFYIFNMNFNILHVFPLMQYLISDPTKRKIWSWYDSLVLCTWRKNWTLPWEPEFLLHQRKHLY